MRFAVAQLTYIHTYTYILHTYNIHTYTYIHTHTYIREHVHTYYIRIQTQNTHNQRAQGLKQRPRASEDSGLGRA